MEVLFQHIATLKQDCGRLKTRQVMLIPLLKYLKKQKLEKNSNGLLTPTNNDRIISKAFGNFMVATSINGIEQKYIYASLYLKQLINNNKLTYKTDWQVHQFISS